MARSRRSRARREQRQLKAAVETGIITTTQRNPVALAACLRGGAGRHIDRKKEASKKACRKPVDFFHTSSASASGSAMSAASSSISSVWRSWYIR
jgi:hypothetical protein